MLGYSQQEMLGLNYTDIIRQEEIRTVFKDYFRLKKKEISMISYESRHVKKDKSKFWAKYSASAVFDKNDNVIAFVGVLTNIDKLKKTEIKIREINKKLELQKEEIQEKNEELEQQKEELQITLENLKQAQKQLVESEKMASLGSLVAGISHEINTPVGVSIAASTTLLNKSKQLEDLLKNKNITYTKLEKYINAAIQASDLIYKNLERTGELVKSFKQISVDQATENKRMFFIKEYFEDVIRSLRPKLKKRPINVNIICDKNIEINSYPGVFAQIITNLVLNSLTHAFKIDEKGEINISVLVDNNKLKIEYSDNGIGISKDILPKIFDPFFTTNKQKGTGLGLNIVYNLITQKLDGTIKCTSQINKGVLYTIMLAIK